MITPACPHFIRGERLAPTGESLAVTDPATGGVLARLPLAGAAEVDRAVAAAAEAFPSWSALPAMQRARVLMRFRERLDAEREALARLVAQDNGKTLAEARGSVQRGIEVVEYAAGIPSLLLGDVASDVAVGVDVESFRQPLGVVAGFTPFNFPVMVPLWMIPLALACGNTFVLKPSERAPLAPVCLAELFAESGAPPGTLNVIHGVRETAEALIAHPVVRAVSVVGSTPVARSVYAGAAALGKRVQALGGAKNHLIVMPDAVLAGSVDSVVASVYGCAGQRCLAGATVVAVGDVAEPLVSSLRSAADALRLGPGLDPATTLGPVISQAARERVLQAVETGLRSGARLVRDGRADRVPEYPGGYFVGPSLFDYVTPDMPLAREEIFGPVLGVMRVRDLDEALEVVNACPYGNSASIYTRSGGAAREFRQRVQAGMLGVNLGVPAPVAFFPFSGWKDSFFGDLHAQGRDAIEFYTRTKVVTSRWLA